MPLPQRKRIRMAWYNYSTEGMYFVTICTQDRYHCFGEMKDNKIILNNLGLYCDHIIQDLWNHRSSIEIHEHIVMPNHVHVLLDMSHRAQWKNTDQRRNCRVSLSGWPNIWPNTINNGNAESVALRMYKWPTLWSIMGMMKWSVTKYAIKDNISFQRQSRYHDRIVRNEKEYEHIAHYIRTNPEKRENDMFYND